MANEQVAVRFVADIQQYQRNVLQAQKLLNAFGIGAEKTSSSVASSIRTMVASYAGLTAAITAVKKTVSTGIDFNKFVETSTAAFGTMMKSVTKAKATMTDLYNFAVNSPLTFRETVASSKQLMAYGFQVKELIPTMEMLGTVAKATGVSLDDMSYVYGTLRSQGRAYTRDLMQFAMRGIPIYEELAKVMGEPVSKLQKLTETGKIGFKEVEKAFQNMTSGTGKFAGYFDEYMKTFEGKMSMLSDLAQQASGTLTESLFGVLKKNVDDFIKILGNNKEQISALGTDLGNIASAFFDIVKAVIPLVPLFVKLIPLLIAKELISTGLKFWKVLPEIFTEIGGSAEKMTAAILKFSTGALGADIVTGASLMGTAVKGLGVAFATAMPEILAVSLAIGGIVVSIMAIVDAFNKAENIRKTQESYRTNKAAATESVSRLGKDALVYNVDWETGQRTKNSIQGQVDAVEELRRVYSALSVNELADILLKNKAISKEAADLIAKLYPIESGAPTAVSYGLSLIEQQAQAISETMDVAQSKFTWVKNNIPKGGALVIPGQEDKFKEFHYAGANASIEFLKGFADAAKTADKTNTLLGILPDPADLKKAYNKELDAIISVVNTLGAMKQKDGTPLFDLNDEKLMGPLKARAQELQKLLAELKDEGPTKAQAKKDDWLEREMQAKYTTESNFVNYQLDDIDLVYDKQIETIKETGKREEWSGMQVHRMLLLNEKLRAQAIQENDQKILEKRRGYENEIKQMQLDADTTSFNNEIANINLKYAIDLQNAQNKAKTDASFAKQYDDYVRALTKKRDADILKQEHDDALKALQFRLNQASTHYNNLSGGNSNYWDAMKIKAGEQYGSGDNVGGAYSQLQVQTLQGSEVGNMASNDFSAASVMGSLVTALSSFLLSIDNVNKVLSPFATILEGASAILKPLISDALQPIVDLLLDIGQVVGQILAPFINMLTLAIDATVIQFDLLLPIINMVGAIFAWLNDSVIVPVGNAMIDVVNGVITGINSFLFMLNSLLGVNISLIPVLQHLRTTTEAAAGSQDAQKDLMDQQTATLEAYLKSLNSAKDKLTDTLDKLKGAFSTLRDVAKDLVNSQVTSLKDLYEVGAISGKEYAAKSTGLWTEFYKYFEDDSQKIIDGLGKDYTLQDVYTASNLVHNQIINVSNALATVDKAIEDTNRALGEIRTKNKPLSTTDMTTLTNTVTTALNTASSSIVTAIQTLGTLMGGITPTTPTIGGADVGGDIIAGIETAKNAKLIEGYQTTLKGYYDDYQKLLKDWEGANAIQKLGLAPRKTNLEVQMAAMRKNITDLGGTPAYKYGTNYVPQDGLAYLHQGEKVIPSDFSSAIDRGEISLSGGKSRNGGDVNVYVTVQGNVQTEKDLAKSIANAIYSGKRSGNITVSLA